MLSGRGVMANALSACFHPLCLQLERRQHLIAGVRSFERTRDDHRLDERHIPRPLQHLGDGEAVEGGSRRHLVNELHWARSVGCDTDPVRVSVDCSQSRPGTTRRQARLFDEKNSPGERQEIGAGDLVGELAVGSLLGWCGGGCSGRRAGLTSRLGDGIGGRGRSSGRGWRGCGHDFGRRGRGGFGRIDVSRIPTPARGPY